MSQESEEDMEHARRFLWMDNREWANAVAEQQKRAGGKAYAELRKADAELAAAVSRLPPPEPVVFAPLPCVECGVSLTNQNHDNHFRCRHCVQREVGMTWTRAHRAIRHERKLKAAVGGAWAVLFYVVLAMAAAAGLGWVGATVAWHIGRLL
jgi:DNA-directed RNA polymerase subunit RPC12/RpoP